MSDPWIGRTLSKVQVQQLIGRGGMADVYVGVHTTLHVQRAVKILQGHLSEDDDLMRRFRDEATAVAELRHPNIVQVYDFDLFDGQPYIVMELLAGMSMSAYLKGLHKLGHTLPLETVGRLLDGIASALDYAHARGIVHRDVKPANVILRQGNTPLSPSIPLPPDTDPVLTDFGIARVSSATTRTLTGTVLGTPAYMSPEQVRGETVDPRSDNYSLGIMLYEMLAGTLPFDPEVDTTASVLYKQANIAPPPLANTSPRVQAIVDRALQKERDARYQKAKDLAAAFRDVARAGATTMAVGAAVGATSTPVPGSAPAMSAEKGRGNRPLWIAVGAIALAVLCLGALGLNALSGLGPGGDTPVPSDVAPATTTVATTTAPSDATLPPIGPPPGVTVAGASIYQDSSLQAIISDAPPPEAGSAYGAWLIGPDGASQVAAAAFAQGSLTIAFVDPQGRNLLALYDEFAVSLEPDPDPAPDVPGPIRFTSRAPETILVEVRRLDVHANGAATTASILEGLRTESDIHDKHLGFSLTAVNGNDLPAAKGHAEHCINVLAGEESPDYGDWNQDGQPQNPGNGFGLIPYLRLALALAESELDNPDLSEETGAALRELVLQLNQTISLAEDSLDVAKRMTASDTIEEIRPLAEEWDTQRLVGLSAEVAQRIEDLGGLRLWAPIRQLP
jgi:serine/threonine-protein kinase